MRLLPLGIAALLACGGTPARDQPAAPVAAAAREYPATRWIPDRPTYAFAARTVRDAQRGAQDMFDSVGMIADVDAAYVSRELRAIFAIDPLSPEAVTSIGIDVEGGIAMFSQSLEPTFVIHLAAPEQTQAFFDQQRTNGLVSQSVIVDGAEIFTATINRKVSVSWVVVADWLWVHFSRTGGASEGSRWFTESRSPKASTWTADWKWARDSAGTPTVLGFVDLRALVKTAASELKDGMACLQLLQPIGRVAIALEGDGRHYGSRIALDAGASAATITSAVLPAPEGWSAVAAQAPLAVQWNLDLAAARGWLAPCAQQLGFDLAALESYGVRTARVLLLSLDPDDKSGSGAVALDLTTKRYFAGLLDEIPLRSKFESKRTFGPHAGRELSIPFGPSVDYVLTDRIALAGMGDGMLARVVGKGVGAPGPVAAVGLAPPGLSKEAWEFLLRTAGIPRAGAIAERLLRWRDVQVGVTVEGPDLVLKVSGNRR